MAADAMLLFASIAHKWNFLQKRTNGVSFSEAVSMILQMRLNFSGNGSRAFTDPFSNKFTCHAFSKQFLGLDAIIKGQFVFTLINYFSLSLLSQTKMLSHFTSKSKCNFFIALLHLLCKSTKV